MSFEFYFWVSFMVTFLCGIMIPSEMSPFDNLIGTLLCSLFGLILWPFFVISFIRTFFFKNS